MSIIDQIFGNTGKPSELKDPFNKDSIKEIHIHMFTWPRFKWMGSIEFKKGNTSGKQNFESNEFGELITKMKTFIESL